MIIIVHLAKAHTILDSNLVAKLYPIHLLGHKSRKMQCIPLGIILVSITGIYLLQSPSLHNCAHAIDVWLHNIPFSLGIHCQMPGDSEYVNLVSQRNATCDGDTLNFTCTTRSTQNLVWTTGNKAYIHDREEVLVNDEVGTVRQVQVNPNVTVRVVQTLSNASHTIIVSELNIVVQSKFGMSTVICTNSGLEKSASTAFYISGIL